MYRRYWGGHGYVTGIFFDLAKPYSVINLDTLLDNINPSGARGLRNYDLNPIFLIGHNLWNSGNG